MVDGTDSPDYCGEESGIVLIRRMRRVGRVAQSERESKPMTFLAECDLSRIYHWHEKIHHENPLVLVLLQFK